MQSDDQPTLFGISHTNRDFSCREDWGKNVFNNAFPVALVNYMHSQKINPVYLKLTKDLKVEQSEVLATDLFGSDPAREDIFFSFESLYVPYEQFVAGNLPRIDLVTFEYRDELISDVLRGIEIKLTALPDNSTADFDESQWGSELVVRPDTIVYLALSIITNYVNDKEKLRSLISDVASSIKDWNSQEEISAKLGDICNSLNSVLLDSIDKQQPIVLQPIWKTRGKSLELDDNALDAFVWSNYGFTRLFIDNLQRSPNSNKVSRPMRTCVWLLKMLYDYVTNGKVNHTATIRNISFGSQTDKAFAVNGRVTHKYLSGDVLLKPRVKKEDLNKIILYEGQKLLSPERRFDAAIMSNASIFDKTEL